MTNFDSIQTDKIAFIDAGNSSIKLGLRRPDHWEIHAIKKPEALLSNLIESNIEYLVVCNVRSEMNWIDSLSDQYSIAVLEIDDIPQALLKYETPETLGIDRILACMGAKVLTEKAVVVIDAGSACTIDYMDENGVFYGGVIMPGVQSLLKVFHTSAPGLPSFEFEIPAQFPGFSSRDSIQWGLSQLFLDGLNANLSRYNVTKPGFDLFITGGDAELVAQNLGADAEVRPDLVFIGMETFLEE